MAAFELNNRHDTLDAVQGECLDPRRIREECIIALKVYDSCRQLHCKLLHPYTVITFQAASILCIPKLFFSLV